MSVLFRANFRNIVDDVCTREAVSYLESTLHYNTLLCQFDSLDSNEVIIIGIGSNGQHVYHQVLMESKIFKYYIRLTFPFSFLCKPSVNILSHRLSIKSFHTSGREGHQAKTQ